MKHPPRKILLAPNAFKGTLTAMQAALCMEQGLRRALPKSEFIKAPIADGGDGMVQAIVQATGGRMVRQQAHDPLGRPIIARWGLTGDGKTAIVEMALASGLALLTPEERDPRKTSTYGTGELIKAALAHGIRTLIIGIGGSATNDGGTGIARALGIRFLDGRGRAIAEGGESLPALARIDVTGMHKGVKRIAIQVACDVDNPLYGPHGAAFTYGPQKGATPAMIKRLDKGLRQLAFIIRKDLGIDVARIPGGGAAGGCGAGLMAFLGARLRPGAELVMDAMNLPKHLAQCDLVITGEGRLDGQTSRGKAPAAIARLARRHGIPVIALCGSVIASALKEKPLDFDAVFSTLQEPISERDLIAQAASRLERCAFNVGKLLAL